VVRDSATAIDLEKKQVRLARGRRRSPSTA
jgi:hypothetical protein